MKYTCMAISSTSLPSLLRCGLDRIFYQGIIIIISHKSFMTSTATYIHIWRLLKSAFGFFDDFSAG